MRRVRVMAQVWFDVNLTDREEALDADAIVNVYLNDAWKNGLAHPDDLSVQIRLPHVADWIVGENGDRDDS